MAKCIIGTLHNTLQSFFDNIRISSVSQLVRILNAFVASWVWELDFTDFVLLNIHWVNSAHNSNAKGFFAIIYQKMRNMNHDFIQDKSA